MILQRMLAYKEKIQVTGKWFGADKELIAAIITQDSHAGRDLKNSWIAMVYKFRLMQV